LDTAAQTYPANKIAASMNLEQEYVPEVALHTPIIGSEFA